MAKKKAQTLEEALVPESEQPYAVPENWVWARLGATVGLYRGVSYKKPDVCSKQDDAVLILRGGNIAENGTLDLFCDDNVYVPTKLVSTEQLLQEGDIVIVSSTGSTKVIGRAGIAPSSFKDVAFGAFLTLVRPVITIEKQYIGLFFLSQEYRNEIRRLAKGVNINNIKNDYITEMRFPLPPLAEQRRIVARIESLFEKLDHARELVPAALDSFETRKAAILHKAFTGELTAQWRAEHGVGMDSWEDKPLGELTNIKSSKRIFAEEYQSEGIPFFRSSEIVDLYDEGITTPQYFISENRYKEIRREVGLPQPGDLLVTSVGTIGKTWIVDDRKFYYKDGNLTLVEKSDHLSNYYLQAFISSMLFKHQIYDTVAGSAYNALTIVKFKKIIIPRPSLPEQIEIVRILDSLLEKEQKAKEQLEPVLDQIDLMKKSILARAFRGELGTNDPSEASALGLLREILE